MRVNVTKGSEHHKKRFECLRGERGTFESHWREVAIYVYPEAEDFFTDSQVKTKGDKRSTRIYESTAQMSLLKYASLVESLVTPRHSKWHGLVCTDPTVMANREAAAYLEEFTNVLFRHRYDPRANFQAQFSENLMSIGAFGNGPFFTDKAEGRKGFRYKSIFLGDAYFDVDFQGNLDTFYRRFDMSHKQAIQKWGEKGVPEVVVKQAEKNPDERHAYIHVVCPNDDMDPGKAGAGGMPFKSYYIHLETGHELETGGYRSQPYSMGRSQTSPHEIYGRGPAMSCLPDIRTLNEMGRADLRATHKLVDPPLLVHDDGVLGSGRQQIYLDPGMVSMGGVSADGRQLVQPLQTGARVDLNEAKMEVKRGNIREAFLVDLFRLHEETKRMTATESMMRNQDRGSQAGPTMGRVQTQLSSIVQREMDIAADTGLIGPPPEILQQALAEGDYDITFDSPLSRMQRAEDLVGIDMVIQQAVTLANAGHPEVLQTLDALSIMENTSAGSGAPVNTVLSREDFEAKMAQQQAQQQQQAQMEAAPGQAAAMKDLAQAEQIQREA